MSFSGLGIGVSALNTAQRALEVAGHNVANANTEGYTRQRVEIGTNRPTPGTFGSRGDGMQGTGVRVEDVVRLRATLVDGSFRAEIANRGTWSARSQVLSRAEQVLGPFDGGAPKALDEFWAAWDRLSLYPDDLAARRGVVDAGRKLAEQLNAGANAVDGLVADTNGQITTTVDEVNRVTAQVAKLNEAIKDATIGQQSPNDLMDERDRLVDRLSELIGATTQPGEHNTVQVVAGNRAIVLGEHAQTLVAVGSAVTWQNDGSPAVLGGRVGAFVDVVTRDLPGVRAQLDTFAVGLRDIVNGTHASTGARPTFDLDGAAGGPFFTGSTAADLTVAAPLLADARKVAAGLAASVGDARNAIAVAGLRTTPAVDTDGLGGPDAALGAALTGIAGRLGSIAAEASGRLDAAELVVESLTRERAEFNSVSIDEEMADIVRFQRSYEAAARFINVVDAMLDKLINATGLVGR